MRILHIFLSFILSSTLLANGKVVLFNDTSAWYHWGCTGTSTSLKEGISHLGFELDAFAINETYSMQKVPDFEDFDDQPKFEQFCAANPAVIAAIRGADAVVINGEGTIHDLRQGPHNLLYLAHMAKHFLAKHVEIVNHSAYPKDSPEQGPPSCDLSQVKASLEQAQKIYKDVYSELDFIAIREPFSLQQMRELGIQAAASFDCLPLYIRDHYQSPKKTDEPTLLLSGSVAYTQEGVEELCRYIEAMNRRGFRIQILVGAAAFPSKDDASFVENLRLHSQAPWQLVEARSLQEWLDAINNASFLVSGRFHHSIAAFCLNTPFIALNSNTPKVDAICSLLNQAPPLNYRDPKLQELLLKRTDELLGKEEPDNRARAAQLCQMAEMNFAGLRALRDAKVELGHP